MKQIIDALEELAQCDFNEANCASLTVASARVRSIARAALAAAREQQQPIGVVVWSDLAGPTVQWLRAPTVGASLYAAPPAPSVSEQQPLNAYIRREVERAIYEAVNPAGMSVHSGMARIGADKLRYLLNYIDRAANPAQDAEDTNRLDWLEQRHEGFSNLDRVISFVGKGFQAEGVEHWFPTLRAAIDAARGSEHAR